MSTIVREAMIPSLVIVAPSLGSENTILIMKQAQLSR